MAALAANFDGLAYIDRLKSGGVDEAQARAHADALVAALRDTVATKSDVEGQGREIRQEIAEMGAALRREMADLRHDLRADMTELRAELRSEMADHRRDMRDIETRLDAKIDTSNANLRAEILRWLIMTQVALAGFIFAAMKFVR